MKPLATVKCPFCEGNTNANRKTLYLYSTDTYWCARCKAYGLTSEIDPSTFQGITPKLSTSTPTRLTEYNNQGERFSVCKQRHNSGGKDTFQIKLVDGSLVGHYTRFISNKTSLIDGVKGFGYRESFLGLGNVYRIVEGPYDCIYPCDVCVFGYPTSFQANQLKWFSKLGQLILCPDGDVWRKREDLKRWLQPFEWFKNVVVEYIPAYKDPDECTQDERSVVEFSKVWNWCNKE